MKKIFASWIMLFTASSLMFGQALKPKIMIIPSEYWCEEHSYGELVVDGTGRTVFVPDFKRALSNSNLRMIINATESFFTVNGFPVENLEGTLSKMDESAALSTVNSVNQSATDMIIAAAKPDIYVDLDFKVVKVGPKTQIQSLNITARDAATTYSIFNRIGDSSCSVATITALCQEVVNSYSDAFLSAITTYFSEMAELGREIAVDIQTTAGSPFALNSNMDFKGKSYQANQLILFLLRPMSQGNRCQIDKQLSNECSYTMRIPLYKEEEDPFTGEKTTMAISAADIGYQLKEKLSQAPFNCTSAEVLIAPKGTGSVYVFIGQ